MTTTDNQAITAMTRTVARNIVSLGGPKVAHTVLRAALLQAQGEHPHAFARGRGASSQTAGTANASLPLVPMAPVRSGPGGSGSSFWGDHLLYLNAPDGEPILSLDPDGEFPLSDAFDYSNVSVSAAIFVHPRASRYDIPEYMARATQENIWPLGLKPGACFKWVALDTGDDSADGAYVHVSVNNWVWESIVTAALNGRNWSEAGAIMRQRELEEVLFEHDHSLTVPVSLAYQHRDGRETIEEAVIDVLGATVVSTDQDNDDPEIIDAVSFRAWSNFGIIRHFEISVGDQVEAGLPRLDISKEDAILALLDMLN